MACVCHYLCIDKKNLGFILLWGKFLICGQFFYKKKNRLLLMCTSDTTCILVLNISIITQINSHLSVCSPYFIWSYKSQLVSFRFKLNKSTLTLIYDINYYTYKSVHKLLFYNYYHMCLNSTIVTCT